MLRRTSGIAPRGTRSLVLRRGRAALSRVGPSARSLIKSAGCPVPGGRGPCPGGRGDGCAKKRCRCDEAPIRRSGPPRHRALDAVGCRSSRRCRVKSPCWCQCRSADAAVGDRTSRRAGCAPRVALERIRPAARRLPSDSRDRNCGVSVALRLHPPRWADVRARRNLTKQPTSRLCSADESVVTSRRCQRPATRSFHGLSFFFKVHTLSAPTRRCHTGERSFPGPKPAIREPVAISLCGKPLRCLTRWNPSVCSPCPRAAEATFGSDDTGWPKPSLAAMPFQHRGGSPLPCLKLRSQPKQC